MKNNFLLIFVDGFYFNIIFIVLFEAIIFQTNDFFFFFFLLSLVIPSLTLPTRGNFNGVYKCWCHLISRMPQTLVRIFHYKL